MSRLFIVGAGVRSGLHLTLEAQQVLSSCDIIFALHDDQLFIERLRRYCCDVRSFEDLYEESQHLERSEIYRLVAKRIVSSARDASRTAFVAFGHPGFLISASHYTGELATAEGVDVVVLPGVSTFDTLLCDLGEDLGYGVQIFCAENLVENKFTLDPRVPLLLFQLTQFRNRYLITSTPAPEDLRPIVTYLSTYYPADHKCKLVVSATNVLERELIVGCSIRDIADRADLPWDLRPTLFVPQLDFK